MSEIGLRALQMVDRPVLYHRADLKSFLNSQTFPRMVAHICNLNTPEVEVGGLPEVQGQLGLYKF